ncbi:ABC transporter ATP-binding protein [Vagococcus elongatus]|uniref:ABC transporter ATP-binding protein n=1 Tax=Vagococcus elongatus TaxID=180344 RepID=A0A430AR60_9ENTE|nr:ATP-binding cassette domain-containing protein [Vagococcus elongatus]RSU10493.1 ABC transporter ATP-binding protein [Vagococcus elongatus]
MKQTAAQDIPVLVIDKVTKNYTKLQPKNNLKETLVHFIKPQKIITTALNDISLTVNKGEFVAYAGANGAGKSTTMKILSGILQPNSGNVRVLGLDPSLNRVTLMKKIGVLFGQRTELWWDQPIITSFEWKKTVWDIPNDVYRLNLEMITDLLDLGPLLNTFSRELSLGQRMRADLGMLLLHNPEVIFLDEPTLGLDVLAKRQMIAFLKELNAEKKTTILVTSHDMTDLEEMAQRIILLSQGNIIFDGNFQQLRDVRGSISEIHIEVTGTPPVMDSLKLLESSGNNHVYSMVDSSIPLNQLLRELSKIENLKNLEIRKTSIEDIIAALYRELRG